MFRNPIRFTTLTAATAFALLLSVQSDSAAARERPGAAARGGAAAGALQRRPTPRNATVTRTVVNDREAGTRSVDVSRTGFDGKTRSSSLDLQRTETGHTASRTLTNAEGQTATRNTTVSNDREAGVRTRESEFTTFDGRSGSSSTTTTRTDNGFTRETRATLPNGATVERSVTKECDRPAGKCTTTVVNGRD